MMPDSRSMNLSNAVSVVVYVRSVAPVRIPRRGIAVAYIQCRMAANADPASILMACSRLCGLAQSNESQYPHSLRTVSFNTIGQQA